VSGTELALVKVGAGIVSVSLTGCVTVLRMVVGAHHGESVLGDTFDFR
jgi:hypothetical protein